MNKTQAAIQALKKRGVTKWAMKNACKVSWNTLHNWDRGFTQPAAEKTVILEKMLEELK